MKARLPRGMGGGPQNMQAMVKQAQKMQEEMERHRKSSMSVSTPPLPAAAW